MEEDTKALPEDGVDGTLIGRAWVPSAGGRPAGPSPVAVRADGVYDLSAIVATGAELVGSDDAVALARNGGAVRLGDTAALVANSIHDACDPARPFLLSPVDLQCVKAAGVTFAKSVVERVIEERARGDAATAEEIRGELSARIGADLSAIVPGSEGAARLKAALINDGLWSQYLEVGIGPDAEVFTKAQPLSSVGFGAEVGVHPASGWNNPEPEMVLVVDAGGQIVGATLGNDVNLRDVEGRSALLLGKAKDNNASCALGPFIRLFDDSFGLDDVRAAEVALTVEGADGFALNEVSSMREISRDPSDLAAQTIGANHQYPDGFVLFTGTMFAPTKDRDAPSMGFTHHLGDTVQISTPKLGTLWNRVGRCDRVPPWTFGIGALMRNLAARGLI
jgi:fumarylacetoacetate (FAA) hydrolase family protein